MPSENSMSPNEPYPRYSIIVPVYEHWHLIPALLRCMEAQTLDQHKFEILLVDNGSHDFAPPERLAANVRILQCEAPGSYAARNHGISQAKGEWLVFTDADCLPMAGWLEALQSRIEALAEPSALLAGAVHMRPSTSQPCIYEMYDLVKGIPQQWYVSRGYAVTANLAAPANTVKQLRGFDASRFSGGDAEFARRAVAAGSALHYVEGAIVEHPARTDWQALATKARRIKGGQLTTGTNRQRALWLFRTFTPPLVAFYRFLTTQQPLRYRLAAVLMQVRLWGVEMREAFCLAFNDQAERR